MSRKVRLSVDCSPEDRKVIKMLATLEDKTISDYLLSLAKAKIAKFASLKEAISSEESSLEKDSDNPWKALGFGS